ncbi:MAG: FG-GAP repeat domain-containing protein [Oscillospiraceae bacterium]
MRHLKRPALLGLLLLACLLLAGCRMDSTMEELFTLPRLPTEYTTLSRQLDQLLSEGYEYMAPTSGRNIQSLQMVDIDGDGRDEALAFFRLNNGEKPLKIYVFHSREDSYELTSIIESSGTAIDSIYYEDLTGDGRKELIVGWKISADVQTVTVYDMRPGPVQLMQSNYTRLSFQELNGDGIPSLLLREPTATTSRWRSFAAGRRVAVRLHRRPVQHHGGAESGQCGHRQAGSGHPGGVHHRHQQPGHRRDGYPRLAGGRRARQRALTAARGSPPPRLPIVS